MVPSPAAAAVDAAVRARGPATSLAGPVRARRGPARRPPPGRSLGGGRSLTGLNGRSLTGRSLTGLGPCGGGSQPGWSLAGLGRCGGRSRPDLDLAGRNLFGRGLPSPSPSHWIPTCRSPPDRTLTYRSPPDRSRLGGRNRLAPGLAASARCGRCRWLRWLRCLCWLRWRAVWPGQCSRLTTGAVPGRPGCPTSSRAGSRCRPGLPHTDLATAENAGGWPARRCRSGQHPSGQHRSGQHRSGQHRSGQHRAGQHRAGQHRASQHCAGQMPCRQPPARAGAACNAWLPGCHRKAARGWPRADHPAR